MTSDAPVEPRSFRADPALLQEAQRLASCLDQRAGPCLLDYAREVDALARHFGERTVVESFLAVHSDPTAKHETYQNVLFAALHAYVSPLLGANAREACATALIATERPFAEALLTIAEHPSADRELGPLVGCIDERLGLFSRTRQLAMSHPNAGLQQWLVSSLVRVHPESSLVAALLRDLLTSEQPRYPADVAERLAQMNEVDSTASCHALMAIEDVIPDGAVVRAFINADGKCASHLDAYVARLRFATPAVHERLEQLCVATNGAGTAGQRERFAAFARSEVTRATDRAARVAAIRVACLCDPRGSRAAASAWKNDADLASVTRGVCK